MTSTEQLRKEIDQSFGAGPALRPVEDRIAAGHRALVRRRVAGGVAALAAVAAVGTGVYAVTPGDPVGSGHVAVDPTSTPTPTPTPSPAPPTPEAEAWGKGEIVRYSPDGQLEVRPGVVVHEHIANPYGYKPPQRSDALDLTFHGHRSWNIVELRRGEQEASGSTPSNGWASFADYVDDQVGSTIVRGGWPLILRLDAQGAVVPAQGNVVLQRTDDPRLGDSFAPPGAPTGAALVQVYAADDQAYFVVWRVIDGELDVIPTQPRDVVGATFEELLRSARGSYASGEGLR
jgi:hypothetical protein